MSRKKVSGKGQSRAGTNSARGQGKSKRAPVKDLDAKNARGVRGGRVSLSDFPIVKKPDTTTP
jgi:hypothetical protein